MEVKKVSFEDLARVVIFSDVFNQDVSMLDMMHCFEIALKNLGLNALLDGASDIDLGNGAVIRCTIAPEVTMSANPTLALCDLAKPHLIEGQRLFASKSLVVAVNDSQPLEDRLADIDLTIRLLGVLRNKLAEGE